MTSEQELIDRVIARDPDAETAFVERYQDLVRGLAHGRLGLDADATAELVQMTFTRLWERDHQALRAWQGRGRFSTYLTVIVLRLGYRIHQRSPADASDERSMVDDAPTPGAAYDRAERRQVVRDALAQASPRDRLLLALRFFDDRKPVEIATVLGRTPGATRKAVHDALGRLRQHLRVHCPDLFAQRAKPDGQRHAPAIEPTASPEVKS